MTLHIGLEPNACAGWWERVALSVVMHCTVHVSHPVQTKSVTGHSLWVLECLVHVLTVGLLHYNAGNLAITQPHHSLSLHSAGEGMHEHRECMRGKA